MLALQHLAIVGVAGDVWPRVRPAFAKRRDRLLIQGAARDEFRAVHPNDAIDVLHADAAAADDSYSVPWHGGPLLGQ